MQMGRRGTRTQALSKARLLVALLLLLGQVPNANADITRSISDYAKLLGNVWTYQPELPKQVLDMAVGLQGDKSRMDRFISKVIRGQQVKVVLLGGSLSLRGWNYPDETYVRQMHKWMELTFVPGCMAEAEANEKRDAEAGPTSSTPAEGQDIHRGPAPLFRHSRPSASYRAAGHMCSTSHIQLISLAMPAAGPGFVERCVLQHVPEDADLVIIDFGVNDFQVMDRLSHPERHALERIFRTLLPMKKQPAILLFEAYSWYHAGGSYMGGGIIGANLPQDKHFLLAEYYGNIQLLSVRSVTWQIVRASNDTRDRLIYLGWNFNKDLVHVTGYGHRWYADILINYFQDVATNMVTKMMALAAAASDSTARGNQRAMSALQRLTHETEPGPPEWDDAAWSGAVLFNASLNNSSEATTAAAAAAAGASEEDQDGVLKIPGDGCMIHGNLGTNYTVYCSPGGLKTPFFLDNEAEPAGVCAIGEEFAQVVEAPHPSWEWVDEGRNGQHKWGFVSESPGAALTMHIDISKHVIKHKVKDTLGGAMGSSSLLGMRTRSRAIMAWLVYLHSWQNLGMAELSCSGACNCTTSIINGLNKDTTIKGTVPALHGFELSQVKEDSGSSDCELKVTVLPTTDSGSHRFKVIGITTSTYPLDSIFQAISQTLKNPDERNAATNTKDLG